jgi:dTDP-4-amino-4,6-dideoxygalactose transaminase
MIKLFNIPNYKINTKNFNHFLHDTVVEEFENNFCNLVGAKYACSFNSATNAIFLSLLNNNTTISIPSIIPPVVCNAIITSGNSINFVDDIDWVGDSYILHEFDDYKIIDSAQKVEKNQFIKEANDNDLMIFSFYPTKPIGSCDGGIIVSNDLEKITWLKEACLNGMTYSKNNWERKIKFPGFKMYMNSIQCFIANKNLKKLEKKNKKLETIKYKFNSAFNLNNTSNHLYRININNRDILINHLNESGIQTGIHYSACHTNSVYKVNDKILEKSEKEEKTTVSIPFHEKLKDKEIKFIIDRVNNYADFC